MDFPAYFIFDLYQDIYLALYGYLVTIPLSF